MKKLVFGIIVLLLFAGCLGTPNVRFFSKSARSYTIKCSNNFDLCLEQASYRCGFKGYKILSKQKTKNGYTTQIKCYR